MFEIVGFLLKKFLLTCLKVKKQINFYFGSFISKSNFKIVNSNLDELIT